MSAFLFIVYKNNPRKSLLIQRCILCNDSLKGLCRGKMIFLAPAQRNQIIYDIMINFYSSFSGSEVWSLLTISFSAGWFRGWWSACLVWAGLVCKGCGLGKWGSSRSPEKQATQLSEVTSFRGWIIRYM